MNTPVKLDELLAAYEWVSAGDSAASDCGAYVNRATGTVRWWGEGTDEELPPSIEDEATYVAVPGKDELDLGRSLVFRFVEEHLPHSKEAVSGFFRKKGAYASFKSLLTSANQLEAWYRYQEASTERALSEWCEENGFELLRSKAA